MQVPAAIDDQADDHPGADDAIYHAVGLEQALAILLDPERQQLLRVASPLGELRQSLDDLDQLIKNGSDSVDVLETKDTWFGVTYQEDKEAEKLKDVIEELKVSAREKKDAAVQLVLSELI